MRALRFSRYGPPEVLHVEELPDPPARAGHLKVRVRAVALNPLDWKIRAGHLRMIPILQGPPRGLGCDFAGEIISAGVGAAGAGVGERVFGSLMPFGRDGALAERIVVPDGRVLPIPPELDFAQAAALPIAAGTALQALTDEAQASAGQRVLITGAAGGVGHFAVQIAKHLGLHVVAVCSAGNAEFVRTLGADEVVDYTREDFARRGDRFDVVFDAACASSFAAARRVLTASGCYLNTAGTSSALVCTAASSVLARLTSRQRAVPIALRNQPELWRRLLQLVHDGALRAHVQRTIAMEEVAAAQREMETGHAKGKVVVRLG